VRGIAGHIEQVEREAIRKSPQAYKHFCPLLPTAMVFVSYGFVLVQVQIQVSDLDRRERPEYTRITNANVLSLSL
jgi:hypothetical protein